MNLLSESLTMGLLLGLIFGSLCFYIYSRVAYVERRIGLMENILLDIKMSQDNTPMHVLPKVPQHITFQQVSAYQKEEMPETPIQDTTSDEEVYTSVLEEAHNVNTEENTSISVQTSVQTPVEAVINYDTMTKDELLEVAKEKGLRVGNRPGREKLLQLLRKSNGSTLLDSEV